MRTLGAGLLALCLAGCGDDDGSLLDVRITTLPEDTKELDFSGARPGEARTFPLEVKSRASFGVTLVARIEDGPEAMRAAVVRENRVLPKGTAIAGLQVLMPRETGAIRGRVVMSSPDLPGWSKGWDFRGEVVDKPMPGRYLRAEPVGVDLGDLRPGETRDFEVALVSFGDEDVRVDAWSTDDGDRASLPVPPRGYAIVPGGRLPLRGRFHAPKAGGPCHVRIRVDSNAQNVQGYLAILVGGKVVPDYALQPPIYGPQVHYPVREPTVSVDVVARKGVPPFVVKAVTGFESHFTLVSQGGDKPAPTQKVVFKLRKDAPWDVHENQTVKVRLQLEPEEILDWPMELRLLPPVYPQPDLVYFGEVPQGVAVRKEFVLATFGPRDFEVTSCRTREGNFIVDPLPHSEGMQWRFSVDLRPATRPGLVTDTVVIETSDPDAATITVHVRAMITEASR